MLLAQWGGGRRTRNPLWITHTKWRKPWDGGSQNGRHSTVLGSCYQNHWSFRDKANTNDVKIWKGDKHTLGLKGSSYYSAQKHHEKVQREGPWGLAIKPLSVCIRPGLYVYSRKGKAKAKFSEYEGVWQSGKAHPTRSTPPLPHSNRVSSQNPKEVCIFLYSQSLTEHQEYRRWR